VVAMREALHRRNRIHARSLNGRSRG
jgi:hypothetical protein